MNKAESLATPPMSIPNWQLLGSNELVGERGDQVNRFRDSLKQAINAGVEVVNIDDLAPSVTQPDKPIELQLLKAVEKRSNGELCLSPDYGWLATAGFTAFHARRTFGAETSAHGVFFGVVHDPNDSSKGITVAVKPCIKKPETAYQDWLNNHLARKIDDRCYEPVGFIVDGGRGYSITKFKRDGFDTLDSTTWDNVLTIEGDPEYKTQIEVISSVAVALAELHKNNIFHGDAQFKNIVLDVTGEVYLIDWESATFFARPPEDGVLQHKISHDMKVLFRSMAMPVNKMGVGLISNFKHPMQWEYFKQYVFDPYMEAYLDGADENDPRFGIIAEVEEQVEEYILTGAIYESFKRQRSHN